MKIKNISPLGDVWNPFTGDVAEGAVIDVPEDVAAMLLEQAENFEAAAEPRTSKEAAK